nr:zinc finger BED domain-containing protein RICESLEEPER 2-like [Coffea arabica]
MLASALEFRDVLSRYGDIDPRFHYVSSEYEWMKVEEICKFLGIFYEITNIISGSDYPTTNLFLVELYRIKKLLNEKALDFSDHIRSMAKSMAQKFDKYWGVSNVLMSLGAILDSRYNMVLVNHTILVIYGVDATPRYIDEIRRILYELYNEYVDAHLMMIVSEIDKALPEKSDLYVCLEEGSYVCDANVNLDVLGWWKGERWRFPILSRMASDVLTIPVTTVAFESTFNVGGRIIDNWRASMSVETVKMLLCGNDWIRNLHRLKNKSHEPLDVPESSTIDEIDLPNI